MASNALTAWGSTGRQRLKELEDLHVQATGSQPGRRWNTQQFNRGLFIALVAQFQLFARSLHDEAVDVHVGLAVAAQQGVLRNLLVQGRKLDTGNPRKSSLGHDFGRLGFAFVDSIESTSPTGADDLTSLDHLVTFRNAIAHGNETEIKAMVAAGGIKETKTSFRAYLKIADRLAGTMDDVVATKLAALLNVARPW